MKKLYSLYLLLTVVCINSAIRAQNFNLIDINKSTDSYPANYQQAAVKNQYAVLDNIVSFFEANDGIHGGELWRSDGTTAGTFMVKDISPGASWSNPIDIITSGEKIFFAANDYAQGPGNELWTSDGTKAGTKKLSAITSNNGNANPTDLTDANGTVYFFTDYGSSTGSELWKTDGTNAGTVKITNFYKPGYAFGNSAQDMVNVNGRVFFAMFSNGSGFQLWTSDGTKEGTMQLTYINTSNYYGCTPFNLTAVNDKLYFGLDDGSGSTRLYVSDGTAAGTMPVKHAEDYNLWRNNIPFTVKGNVAFFSANTSDGIGELCKVNSTDKEGIKIVSSFGYYYPDNLINVNNTIYFTVPYNNDNSLWKSDGTTAGTVLVKDANPGGTNWYTNFTAAKNKLMFSYYDDTNGFELWQSDGTDAGTNIVKDIYPGIYSCSSNNLTYVNGFILFGANDGVQGQELWKSDGTTAGTALLKNINTSATSSSYPFSVNGYVTYGLQGIVSPSNKLLFNATDVQYGNDELFISDGTAAGTQLVKDIDSGSNGSYPYYFASLNGETYFIAQQGAYTQIWKSDGTNAGTSVISVPAVDDENGYNVGMVATNNFLYLMTFNYSTYQYEIWRSDGTVSGTFLIQTFYSYYTPTMKPVDNNLFFSYYDGSIGNDDLWVTDGSLTGTKLLTDKVYNPVAFTAYNDKLYFGGENLQTFTQALWSSDGTKAGTRKVKDVNVDYSFQPTIANNKLFFYGDDYSGYGDELWSTNGTTGGTRMIKDINKGLGSSNVSYSFLPETPVAVDTEVYFIAYDGVDGPGVVGLWKSDGTKNNTRLIKTFYYRLDFHLVAVKNQFYFLDSDSLWISDGTDSGTVKVNDPNLASVSGISDLITIGDQLFFTGYTDAAGQELYAGSASNMQNNKTTNNFSSISNTKINTGLIIFPNPAKDVLNVKLNSNNYAGLIVTDVSGRIILNRILHNETTTQLNVSHLSSGTYFIKLISVDGKEKAVTKFVKE